MADIRYKIIKPRYLEGKIKRFDQIIKVIPKTVIANDLHKNSDTFTRLIKEPEGFTLKELTTLGHLFNLTLQQMFDLVTVSYPERKQKSWLAKDKRYDYIRNMVQSRDISAFEEIFNVVPRSIVAKDLKTKRDRLGRLLHHIEQFTIYDLLRIGYFCRLSKTETFSLVTTTYTRQNNYNKKNRKSE